MSSSKVKALVQQAHNEEAQQPFSQQASNQRAHQAHVNLNWIFFDRSFPTLKSTFTRLPRPFFEQEMSIISRDIFATQIWDELEFEARESSIKFWKPRTSLQIADVNKPGWIKSIKNVEDLCEFIAPSDLFAEHVNEIDNRKILHLVITAKGSYKASNNEEYQQTRDIATELPEIQRYHNIVLTSGKIPPARSKSKEYAVVQTHEHEAIHDGRLPPMPRFATVAPPVQIFHPVFDKFLKLVADPSFQPTKMALKKTSKLMRILSVIGWDDEEGSEIRWVLMDVLGLPEYPVDVHEEPILDNSAGGSIHAFAGNGTRSSLIIEIQRELGDSGSDPSTNAGLSMRRLWIQNERKEIRDKCCCPTLILTGGGPWLGVLGGVFTDKVIVQRLTDLMWVGLSSTEEDTRVYRLARVLNALRICNVELQSYYDEIAAAQDLTLTPHRPHPRFYPCPTSFTDENGQAITFQYLAALEDHPACVTYKARTSEEDIIVVKFVSRYSADAHAFLARRGCAPRLRFFGPLPAAAERLPMSLTKTAPPGMPLGLIHMIVMDYVPDSGRTPANAREQVEAALRVLHIEGYVFGDLRRPNVLFDEKNELKLIDFDWAGRFDVDVVDDRASSLPEGLQEKIDSRRKELDRPAGDYVCYPLNMSQTLSWAEGMVDLEPIRPVHDWDMLKKIVW